MEQKQTILHFLKSNSLAVIATSASDMPEAAVVDFSETEDLEIIFSTLATYRKYANLKKNPAVAFVVGGQDNVTVQYQGTACELTAQLFEPYKKAHIQKNPVEEKFCAMPEIRYFKVVPTWVRYADYGADPHHIFEITF